MASSLLEDINHCKIHQGDYWVGGWIKTRTKKRDTKIQSYLTNLEAQMLRELTCC